MKRKSAFTLVEIMIVVAIIALLAAIAVPGLLRARLNANNTGIKSTLSAIATAAESYAAANGAYPAAATNLTTSAAGQPAYLPGGLGVSGAQVSGHTLSYTFAATGYSIDAAPVTNLGTCTGNVTTGSTWIWNCA